MLKWFVVSSVLITGCFSTHGAPSEHGPAHGGTSESVGGSPAPRENCPSELPAENTTCPPLNPVRYGWDGENCVSNCHGTYASLELCRREKPSCACPEALPEVGRVCDVEGKFCGYERACNSPTMLCDAGRWRVYAKSDGPCPKRFGCEPDRDVAWNQCLPVCDGGNGYVWDGIECVLTQDGCGGRFSTLEACEAAHTQCMPSVCERTGGTLVANGLWPQPAATGCCGEIHVNVDMGEKLSLPFVCACPSELEWSAGSGCVPNRCDCLALPNEVERCEQTGGSWILCPECFRDYCACPPGTAEGLLGCEKKVFDFAKPDERCGPQQSCGGGAICCEGAGGDSSCRRPECSPELGASCPAEMS